MNQIRDVVNLDTKAFIMFSDLIKQFYEVKSDALKNCIIISKGERAER